MTTENVNNDIAQTQAVERFFEQIEAIQGTVEKKRTATDRDSIEKRREKLMKLCGDEISRLECVDDQPKNKFGQPKGKMFERQTDGRYKLVLRFNSLPLNLNGKNVFFVADQQKACAFFANLAMAAQLGRLDAELLAKPTEPVVNKYLSASII